MEKPLQSLKPELNPLTNPILGRNLERWARVYFNTPPEKRDQAVLSLLHELENEGSGSMALEPSSHAGLGDADFQEVVCPACGRRNQPYQRFCGICGSPFPGADSVAPDRPAAAPLSSEKDLEWLRQRAFSSLDQPEPASNVWKYLIAIVAVVLAGLLYLQWGSRPRSTTSLTPPPTPSATLPEATPEPAPSAEDSTASIASNAKPKQVEKNEGEGEEPMSKKPAPAANAVPDSPPPATTENGAQELQLAQDYLQERSNAPGAVKLLWKAVGKQNTGATLLLADLYARGEGVPKSCDQARLLLVAAAKKGVSEAAQKLRSLDSSGCQ